MNVVINGREFEAEWVAHHTLLDVLRDEIGLTGTKECCAEGECGACTVLMDGHAVNSCLVLAVEADGHEVTTVEGLAEDGIASSPIQDAFLDDRRRPVRLLHPRQGHVGARTCCARTPQPTTAEIREGLSGNLCRCGGYNQICAAVASAASTQATG